MFTLIVRKHHCASCGKIYCGKCSKIRANSDKGYLVRQRFCIKCEKECVSRSRSAQRLNYLHRGRPGGAQTPPSPDRDEPGSRSTSTGSQRRRSGTCSCSVHVEAPLSNLVVCSMTKHQPKPRKVKKRQNVTVAEVEVPRPPQGPVVVSSPRTPTSPLVDTGVQTDLQYFNEQSFSSPTTMTFSPEQQQISLDETLGGSEGSDGGESCHELSSYDLDLDSILSRMLEEAPILSSTLTSNANLSHMSPSLVLAPAPAPAPASTPASASDHIPGFYARVSAVPLTETEIKWRAESAKCHAQQQRIQFAWSALAAVVALVVLATGLLGLTFDRTMRAQSAFFQCRAYFVHFCSHEEFFMRRQFQDALWTQGRHSHNGVYSADKPSTTHPPGFYSLLSAPYVSFLVYSKHSGSAQESYLSQNKGGARDRQLSENSACIGDTEYTTWQGGLFWLLNSVVRISPGATAAVLPYEPPESAEQVAAGLSPSAAGGPSLPAEEERSHGTPSADGHIPYTNGDRRGSDGNGEGGGGSGGGTVVEPVSINFLLVLERRPFWNKMNAFAGGLFRPLKEGMENADDIYI